MTTYTGIANGDIDADSPITTGLVTLLRDNPIAITEGAAGAPTIATAAIDDDAITAAKLASNAVVNASVDAAAAIATSKLGTGGNDIPQSSLAPDSVGQSEVKTTYQEVEGDSNFTATGGIYVIGHRIDGTTSSPYCLLTIENRNNNNLLSRYRWEASTGGGQTLRLYYINASPPYDLGDGEIPLFVYALIKNGTGEVINTNLAPDPIWAYNGPTNWAPHAKGNKMMVKDMTGISDTFATAKATGGQALADYTHQLREAPLVEIEITQEIKNADMDIISDPWGENIPGHTIVMLDPVSDFVLDLAELYTSGEKLGEIVRDYATIGNNPLPRKGPAALMMSSCRWKQTGAM